MRKTNKFKPRLLFIGVLLITGVVLRLVYQASWNGKSNFNLAFWLYQTGGLLCLQPEHRQAVVVIFPGETILPVAEGFGNYRAKSIYALGEQEKLGGGYLWQLSTERFLGVMTDGYLVNLKSQQPIKKSLLLWTLFQEAFKPGQLAGLDALRAWWFILKLRPDQLEIIDLVASGVAQEQRLANGDLAYSAPEEKIDQLLKNFLPDSTIAAEDLRVVVLNATNQPGVGSWFSRVLTNHGSLVVHVANAPSTDTSVIEISNEDILSKSLVKKTIKKFNFNTKVVDNVFYGRGDAGYILAEDFNRGYFITSQEKK